MPFANFARSSAIEIPAPAAPADTHKRTHTCGAVDGLTAAARGELTVPARKGSFGKLLRWAR